MSRAHTAQLCIFTPWFETEARTGHKRQLSHSSATGLSKSISCKNNANIFLFNKKLLTNYGLEGPFNHKYLLSTPFPTDSSSSLCPCLLSTVLPYTILCPLLSSVIHLSYSVICPHLFLLCHHLSF